MIGMNSKTGRALSGLPHLYQSIREILTTSIGSRIERRDFGSELPELIDAPNHAATRVRLYAATAAALMSQEPRLKLLRVRLAGPGSLDGSQVLDIEGIANETGEPISASVPLNQGIY